MDILPLHIREVGGEIKSCIIEAEFKKFFFFHWWKKNKKVVEYILIVGLWICGFVFEGLNVIEFTFLGLFEELDND